MSIAPTTTAPPPQSSAGQGDGPDRTVRARRSLPGGRAVVGAFLVMVAAIGTFGAYLQATAEPSTTWLVAARGFTIGHVLTEADLALGSGVRTIALELPDEQASRLYADPGPLIGATVVAPIAAGDLLLRSHVAEANGPAVAGGLSLSFSIATDRALGGSVAPGERVDVIATFRAAGSDGTETSVVARQIVVVTASALAEGLNGGRITLTVQVPDLATAQRLQHAVDVAQVALVRGGDPAVADPTPTTSDTIGPDSGPGSQQGPASSAASGSGGQG